MTSNTIRATYHDGAFIPHVSCPLPDNTEVELRINSCRPQYTEIIDAEARMEILQILLQRMRQTTSMAYTTHHDPYRENREKLSVKCLDNRTRF